MRKIIDYLPEIKFRSENMKALVVPMEKSGLQVTVGDDGTWIHMRSKDGHHFSFQPAREFGKRGYIMQDTVVKWCNELQNQYELAKRTLQIEIQTLQAMPVIGNAHDDAQIFGMAHAVITNPVASLEEQIIALKKMDEATGEIGEYTQEAVNEYLESVS